jgi:hypothetical protein
LNVQPIIQESAGFVKEGWGRLALFLGIILPGFLRWRVALPVVNQIIHLRLIQLLYHIPLQVYLAANPLTLVSAGIARVIQIYPRKEHKTMKTILSILGVLITFVGGVWFMQGERVLLGSPMTGQSQWVYFGAITVVLGLGLLVFANLRKSSPPKQ